MNYLNKITDQTLQQFFLTGIPQENISLTLRYLPTQQLWTMDLASGLFAVNNVAIVQSPNLLRAWRNVIDFGICCNTATGINPLYNTDFQTQVAALYLLDAADVALVEEQFFS